MQRVATTTTPAYVEKYENKPICKESLGVENGQLYPKQISVSSSSSATENQKPKLIDLLKLSSPIGWKPSLNSPNEYIKVSISVSGPGQKGLILINISLLTLCNAVCLWFSLIS